MLRKMFAAIICAVCISAPLCGCDSKGDNEQELSDIQYYGQAIKEVDGKDIYLIYDGNYVPDEEMDVLGSYYVSIQNKDQELFKSTQSAEYLSYLEEKQSLDAEGFIEEEYSGIEYEVGEDFKFTQIEVTDCGNGSQDLEIGSIKEMLDEVYKDAGRDKSFSDTVKDEKYVVYTIKAKNSMGEVYTLADERKYIFNCDDGIYIF